MHFAYFYVLWMTIQFAFKAPGLAARAAAPPKSCGFISSRCIDPFGTLWFIYLLPIFFVVIKLTRRVPVPVDLARRRRARDRARQHRLDGAGRIRRAASSISTPATSSRRTIFALAARVQAASAGSALAGLLAWGLVNGTLVYLGYETLPFVSLALGLAGAVRGGHASPR